MAGMQGYMGLQRVQGHRGNRNGGVLRGGQGTKGGMSTEVQGVQCSQMQLKPRKMFLGWRGEGSGHAGGVFAARATIKLILSA